MLSSSDRSIPAGKIERMVARKRNRYIKSFNTNGWDGWNKIGKQWREMTKGAMLND